MSRKQAYVYFYASYCGKSHHIHESDIFQLKIRIPDEKSLFATLVICYLYPDITRLFLDLWCDVVVSLHFRCITCSLIKSFIGYCQKLKFSGERFRLENTKFVSVIYDTLVHTDIY